MGCGCRSTAVSGAVNNYEGIPAAAGTTRQVFATQAEAEIYVARNGGGHTKPTTEPVSEAAAA